MKNIVVFILLLSSLFLAIDFSTDVDYSSFEYVSWEKIQKNQLNVQPIDISKKIKLEKVSKETINTMNLFPPDERWVVKKYSKENIFLFGTYISKQEILYNNKRVFFGFPEMKIDEDNLGTIIYQDNKYMIAMQIGDSIDVFDKEKELTKEIIGIEDYTQYEMIPQRLIDVKGEWITVLGWVNAQKDTPQPNYLAYMKIYRYNLKTKKVDIYSSLDNNVFIAPPDHGTEPVTPASHDISLDHRYIYIPGVYLKEGKIGSFAFGKEYKVIPGLYVFDWWTLKLYKLTKVDAIAVINNTDDGYVYIQADSKDQDIDFVYYRFKNPEAMLNELGKK